MHEQPAQERVRGVIYNAFLRANYFFVLTDSGFGGGVFAKGLLGREMFFIEIK
jgi:hypothetical protein